MQFGSRQKGGVLAGLLIGLLVLIGLFIAGSVILGLFIARNVRVQETSSGEGKTVRIQTPVGSMRVREQSKADPRDFGLPVYPGAVAVSAKGKTVNFEVKLGDNEKGFDLVAADYATPDSVDKVAAFYRKELPRWMVSSHEGHVEMRFSEEGYKRIIAIRNDGGRTRISLVQIGEPPEN